MMQKQLLITSPTNAQITPRAVEESKMNLHPLQNSFFMMSQGMEISWAC